MATSPKFKDFNIIETPYKVIDGQNIDVAVLVPKSASSTPRPVIVKFHGGFLITGTALFPDWFPDWLIEYSLLHNAVVVAPNYRLLPESNGIDIIEDLNDFWTWLEKDLQAFLDQSAAGTNIDLTKVLVTGESAGGYLAVQSGLSNPSALVRAVIATYPVLDLKSPFFSQEYEKVILGQPTLPKSILADHIKALEKGKIVTSASPPSRLPLCLSLVQQGEFLKYFGDEKILYPVDRIDEVKEIPFTLILHGEQDSAVPVEGSKFWYEKAVKAYGPEKVILHVEPGEHGFDTIDTTLETPWLKQELAQVTTAWLVTALS